MADIGEKNYLMSGVAQESTSNEIKSLVQNIKPGDAKESSVQEVLNTVGNVAQQEDMQEILNKLSDGVAGVTAQTKKFTTTAYFHWSITQSTPHRIEGSGRFIVTSVSCPNYTAQITIDDGGTHTIEHYSDSMPQELYFERSVQVVPSGNSTLILKGFYQY